jgi:hypothetical protein
MKIDWRVRKKMKLLGIPSLVLNDIDDAWLEYLSAAAHTYFSGNTRIHGTIVVEGPKEERLESLDLAVVQNGAVVAVADLTQGVRPTLLDAAFGADEKVEVSASRLLFELLSSEAAKVDGRRNGNVTLRARARCSDGQETERDFGPVQIVVRFTGANRYGGRDPHRGGDDWVKPSVKDVLDHFAQFTWGDCSNMNAGSFSPDHATHRTGNDADGHFAGFNARDAAAAQTLIAALNDDTFGSRIATVYVTFTPAFRQAIQNVVLDDGRRATAVFNDERNHDTHFHFVITDR